MDPLLSDEQIIERLNPLERRFLQWYEQDNYKRQSFFKLQDTLRQAFPDQDPDQIFHLWNKFVKTWLGRHSRRMNHVIQRDKLVEMYSSTPCKDPEELASNLWVFNICNIADLFLGESDFGGTLTGYAVDSGSHFLHSDISHQNMSDPKNPSLLDSVILSMGLDGSLSRPAPTSSDTSSPRKRREENRSSSGEDSAICMRTASSNDFIDKEPFCFFQLGSLLACTGQQWADVRNKGQGEINDASWEETGYGVVIELSPDGYPQGPVYVVYNFHEVQRSAAGPVPVQIEWKDPIHHEVPHIRRLYPSCNRKFFLAKIADKLQHLDTGVSFDFEIIEEHRCRIMRTKLDGTPSRIIPNDILAEGPSDVRKRVRVEGPSDAGKQFHVEVME